MNVEEGMKEYHPLVVKLARSVRGKIPKHILYDDLVQAGRIGLWKALERYEEKPGVKFGTYASIRIRGAINDELRTIADSTRTERENGTERERVNLVDIEDLDEIVWEESTPYTILLEKEQLTLAVDAINKLPERDRELIGLKYKDDISAKEIGGRYGLGEDAVFAAMRLAIKRASAIYGLAGA